MSAQIVKVQANLYQIQGSIGFDNAESFKQHGLELLQKAEASLVFDLSGLQTTGSVGAAVFLAWQAKAHQRRIGLEFKALSEEFLGLIRVSGLDEVLSINQRASAQETG